MRPFLGIVHQAVPHLVHDPVQPELRVDRGALLVAAQAAHDQFVREDVQGRTVQHIGDAVGALQDLGLPGMLPVGLRHQFRPVGRHEAVGGLLRDGQDAVDAREGGRIRRVAGDGHAPLLVPRLHRQRMGVDLAGVPVGVGIPGDVLFARQGHLCHVFLRFLFRPPLPGRTGAVYVQSKLSSVRPIRSFWSSVLSSTKYAL